jgi:ketosteroid isomerase-like protein
MRPHLLLAALLASPLAAAPLAAQPASPPVRVTKTVPDLPGASASALDAVVAAERAFSQASAERGMRDAFLAYMADDGVVLRERVALGKPYYAAMAPTAARLTWTPVWGAVSASGDLALTSGPWTLRASPQDSAPAVGQFASVWARQPDGQWKVLADVGATSAAGTPVPEAAAPFAARPLAPVPGAARGAASSAAVLEGQRAMLLVADRGLAAAGRADGAARALAAVAAEDVRALWPGAAPALGRDAATRAVEAHLAAAPGAAIAYQTTEARLARAGDLGITWGTYALRAPDAAPTEAGTYLRVWTRENGGWRVLLDALAPANAR